MPGERIIDVDRNVVLGLAHVRGDIDLMLLCRPRRRTSGPKNAGSCSMRLGGNAKGSRSVVIIPRVSGNQDVRRVGGHGRKVEGAALT